MEYRGGGYQPDTRKPKNPVFAKGPAPSSFSHAIFSLVDTGHARFDGLIEAGEMGETAAAILWDLFFYATCRATDEIAGPVYLIVLRASSFKNPESFFFIYEVYA